MTNPTSLCVATRAFKARATAAFERIVATSVKPTVRHDTVSEAVIELDTDAALTYARTIELGGSALIWETEGTDEATKA